MSDSQPLITPAALAERLHDDALAILDCRFDLGAPEAGHAAWLEQHVPGAVYAHLERDLSGPPATDHGRHPLPPPARLCEVFSEFGIDVGTDVVVYDDAYGMVAARAWWMLRYMGHATVAVLDGGWQAWVAAALPVASGEERRARRAFAGSPDRSRLVTLDAVTGAGLLVDAREPGRYRGEFEPIDPHAGHIPGARNHFWRDNVADDGCLLAPAALRERLAADAGAVPDADTVHYCGSGVSACHNVLAQVVAGLPEPRLYCGSWSEWCRARDGRGMIE